MVAGALAMRMLSLHALNLLISPAMSCRHEGLACGRAERAVVPSRLLQQPAPTEQPTVFFNITFAGAPSGTDTASLEVRGALQQPLWPADHSTGGTSSKGMACMRAGWGCVGAGGILWAVPASLCGQRAPQQQHAACACCRRAAAAQQPAGEVGEPAALLHLLFSFICCDLQTLCAAANAALRGLPPVLSMRCKAHAVPENGCAHTCR
jgi:hypothetical protein